LFTFLEYPLWLWAVRFTSKPSLVRETELEPETFPYRPCHEALFPERLQEPRDPA
jgi:hypothetical protein